MMYNFYVCIKKLVLSIIVVVFGFNGAVEAAETRKRKNRKQGSSEKTKRPRTKQALIDLASNSSSILPNSPTTPDSLLSPMDQPNFITLGGQTSSNEVEILFSQPTQPIAQVSEIDASQVDQYVACLAKGIHDSNIAMIKPYLNLKVKNENKESEYIMHKPVEVTLLAPNKSDFSEMDYSRNTLFGLAALMGEFEIVKCIMNAKDNEGRYLATNRHLSLGLAHETAMIPYIRLLNNFYRDVNLRLRNPNHPLHDQLSEEEKKKLKDSVAMGYPLLYQVNFYGTEKYILSEKYKEIVNEKLFDAMVNADKILDMLSEAIKERFPLKP